MSPRAAKRFVPRRAAARREDGRPHARRERAARARLRSNGHAAGRAHGPWSRRLADALGLAFIAALLLDLLHPSLLLLPTITAGGDTPCHYPTAVWLKDQLLPQLRLHGWYPGTYLGQPLLLTYFPLPFVLMAALSP